MPISNFDRNRLDSRNAFIRMAFEPTTNHRTQPIKIGQCEKLAHWHWYNLRVPMKSERATERVSEWLRARKKWNIWWHNDIHGPCLIIWCVILYVYVSLQKCINLFDILCELQFFVRIAIGFQGVRSFIVASYGLVVQLPHGLRQPNTYTHRERKKRCVVLCWAAVCQYACASHTFVLAEL